MTFFKTQPIIESLKLPVRYSQLTPQVRWQIRMEYRERQKDLCWFCHKDLNSFPATKIAELPIDKTLFPPEFFNYPVHLHHDHTTDLTLGAVHAHCNAILWQYHGE